MKREHRCPFPSREGIADGWTWTCYGCGVQYVASTFHVEDLVAIDNASNIDIGWDEQAWVKAS